ncbi:MAG: bifunctional riboflavin kinase/FAD synthetase [Desulfuromonadales bacterium]|nr:bifunctional riboflavin kinase/FAD synthetase [Desulfuromonadales bacterium]
MQLVRGIDNLTLSQGRTALTIGNFDGVHLGHREVFRRVLRKAKELDALAGVLTFEPHPLRLLAPQQAPARINTPEEKVRLVEASCVDLLAVLDFTPALAKISAQTFVEDILLRRLGMCHLVIGYDYAFGRNREGDATFLARKAKEFGFSLEILEPVQSDGLIYSSTQVRELVGKGCVDAVVDLLGRNFTLDGHVIHGEGRGRKLGFPTANLLVEKELLPKNGVYAVKVKWRDVYYDAVVNIGQRPTFEGAEPSLEIHLLDFEGDLYGERLRIYFVARLRDEARFSSVELLQQAVLADIERGRGLLAEAKVVEYREYLQGV